jgi:hypothetical protein
LTLGPKFEGSSPPERKYNELGKYVSVEENISKYPKFSMREYQQPGGSMGHR